MLEKIKNWLAKCFFTFYKEVGQTSNYMDFVAL